MSIDTRLNKLSPGLTARERGILILRSYRDRTPEDPTWLSKMPPEQRADFNHYIDLMNGANTYLPLFITMVEGWAEQMGVRMRWLMDLIAYGTAIWELGRLIPEDRRAEAEALVARWSPDIELPWVSESRAGSWLDVAEGMEQTIRECVAHLWDDVMAIDALLAEVAAEFGGEDPMKPVMRGQLEKARATLELLLEVFSGKEATQDRQPSESSMALARTYFDPKS